MAHLPATLVFTCLLVYLPPSSLTLDTITSHTL